MSDFEDRINSILSDPGQMEKISQMASKLMGGMPQEQEREQEDGEEEKGDIFAKVGRMLGGNGRQEDDKTALLRAMRPYLSKERGDKLEKAMRFAKIARIAGAAFRESGGEESD